MDEHNNELTEVDRDATPSRPVAAAENHRGRAERRTQRLDELTDEALDEPDPLRANLKAASAQLFDIAYQLGDEVRNNIASNRAKRKARRESTKEVSTLMLVHRQIKQYVQLDQQWASEGTSGDGSDEP